MTGRTDTINAMRNLRSALDMREKVTTRDEAEFCHHGNIEDAVSTLSEELESLGISAATDATGYSESIESFKTIFINLTNASWSLVHAHRGLMRAYEALKDAQHKVSNDNANLTNHVKRLKEIVGKKEHALRDTEERERRLKVEAEKLSRELKRQKEEAVKLRKQLHSKDVQHAHELRRVQQNGHKLGEQLKKFAGARVSNDKSSGKIQPDQTEEKLGLYEKTIRRLENNNGLMLEEINELREALALHAGGLELQVEASGVWTES